MKQSKTYEGIIEPDVQITKVYELKICGVKDITLEFETVNELNAALLKVQLALLHKHEYVELQDYLIVLKHVYYVRSNLKIRV